MEGEIKPEQISSNLVRNNSTDFTERIFFNIANKHADNLGGLKEDLNGANMPVLVQNYFSKVLFYTLSSFFLGLILGTIVFLLMENLLLALLIVLLLPITSFVLFYSYPSLKRSSIEKQMDEELPFATIYMAAVSSSDLEPTKMFRLIANSKEYPSIGIELKKVVNQVELYGYNLATALTNVARNTKSKKVAELFSGMAINITSGGSLKNYLEKKSENLLVDYKLDRQKYNSVAETFMDVYISVLITAPLILMIVFVVMNMTGFDIGIGIGALNLLVILLVSVLNVIFLSILQIKQPKN
jgi:archaeal flagellar protein FlaJ